MSAQNPGSAYSEAAQTNMKANKSKVPPVVFRCNIPHTGYVFKNGKHAAFVAGKYVTDIAYEVEELNAEIEAGHPNIHCNPEEKMETIEPIEALRKRIINEYVANEKRALDKNNDAGSSEQTKLKVANSDTIGAGAASSDSPAANPTVPAATKINVGGQPK